MKFQILDHGYVEFVEGWGSDESIIEAARMSTGKGFNGWGSVDRPGDEKLLAFLYNNKHATPFEMGGVVIEVKAPIFVFREWHRHRTQCLAGSSVVQCVSPRGTVFNKSIEDIHRLKHGDPDRKGFATFKNGKTRGGRDVYRTSRIERSGGASVVCQNRTIRSFQENGDFIVPNEMIDVVQSGMKETFKVGIDRGHATIASKDHLFLTREGWKRTEELEIGDELAYSGKVVAMDRPYPPLLRQGIGVWTSMMRSRIIKPFDTCYLCGKVFEFDKLELDHIVPVAENLELALVASNLAPACCECHKEKSNREQKLGRCTEMTKLGRRWSRLSHLPYRVNEEMTYDLVVNGPHHNFSCNKMIVHNSYNEMSARYISLPNENYVPSLNRVLAGANTATTNKQAQGSGKLVSEAAAASWQSKLESLYDDAQRLYEHGIDIGIPKELARICVPVARYSRMRASANLRNWLAFLTLRQSPAAQWEIREYADAVGKIIADRFPRTWELFTKEINSVAK
jgi:thymidylate synthase ThyX